MIVNQTETGWEIIYHRAHALLAAQIAGHWQQKDRPERSVETIAAISCHDDLEKEWEGNQLTPAGTPLDFTLDQEISVERLNRLVTNAQYRGRWVAMLISMHMSFLYEGMRGKSAELDEFLDKQKELQQQWQQDLQLSQAEAEKAYAFMQWCDRLSLILSMRQIPDGERYLEISEGPNGKRYDLMQRQDGSLYVNPWPFKEEKFTVNVEATYLSQVKFDSDAELTQTLKQSPIELLEWQFVKSN